MKIFPFLTILLFISQSFFKCFSQNQGIFWQITRSDIADTSYLFGTHHRISNNFSIPFSVKKKLKKTAIFYHESTSNTLHGLIYFRSYLAVAFNPKFRKLDKFITKEKYDSIKQFMIHKYKISQSTFNFYSHLRPILIEESILGTFKDPFSEKKYYSIDDSLGFYARKNFVDRRALENAREIAKQFKLIPIAIEADLAFNQDCLSDTVVFDKSLHKYEEDTSYLKGELTDFFMKPIDKMTEAEKVVNSVLLINRNFDWILKIEPKIRKKSVFIAVGIGHLLPEKYGIIDLLRAKGYKVECIMKDFK